MVVKRNLFILIFCFLCLGADTPRLISYPEEKIMGFRGLDTQATAPTIADSRAQDLQNVKLSKALDLRQRYGYNCINNTTLDDLDMSPPPPITGIFRAGYSNATSKIYAFVGTKLKYDNGAVWSTATGNPTITNSKDNQWLCKMAFDYAVCTNDTDLILKVDKDAVVSTLNVSDLTDALTKTKVIAWYRNYLIHGNTVEAGTDRPTRFRWSDVGTIETYDDDNFNDIATFAGDEIIGFTELYGDLYILLTESIWKASLVGGDEIFTFKKVIDGIGAVSRDSIQTIQLPDNRTAIVFLTKRLKIMMFNGYSLVDIGERIQDTLDGLNKSRLQYSVATFNDTNYLLSVSNGSATENDLLLDYNMHIQEWTKHTRINANALAQVEESAGTVKSYFGNYDSKVYWLDDPSLKNDVDGATGIIDSVSIITTATETGAQIFLDSTLTSGAYTGAIIKISSGTASGLEGVILTADATSITVTTAFTTTPDSSSVYTIGAIDSYYNAKWYEMGSASREKSFIGLLMWAEEDTNNEVTLSYAVDFGNDLGSETKSLSPASGSLWDSAIWDQSVWGTTGDKIYTFKLSGFGNFLQPRFSNSDIDKTFHLYGFNLLGIKGDVKQ